MNTYENDKSATNDPLGLRELDSIQPDFDGWPEIESALKAQQASNRRWRQSVAWLAVAASLVLATGLSIRGMHPGHLIGQPATTQSTQLATTSDNTASLAENIAVASDRMVEPDNLKSLMNLSNKMQAQVRNMRQKTASMPADSAMFVAELEDLIAQIDNELSYTPDSIDLWGQRVNLLLDLAQVYQQQWQLDYGRIASL